MGAPTLTRDLAWSAAQDAANTAMRTAGRSKWSSEDYALAVREFDRLWPESRDYTPEAAEAFASINDSAARFERLLAVTRNRYESASSDGDVVRKGSPGPTRLESDKEYNAECAEFWRGIVRKLIAGDTSALTEEEQRLVDRVRQEIRSGGLLCSCGHARNRHAAYSSGTSCADCNDCRAYDGPPVLPEDRQRRAS